MAGAIFLAMVPATIITSDWRGEGLKTPAPKRSRSKREAPAAIISIAQHARPNVIGHSELARARFRISSRRANWTTGAPGSLTFFSIQKLLFARRRQLPATRFPRRLSLRSGHERRICRRRAPPGRDRARRRQ